MKLTVVKPQKKITSIFKYNSLTNGMNNMVWLNVYRQHQDIFATVRQNTHIVFCSTVLRILLITFFHTNQALFIVTQSSGWIYNTVFEWTICLYRYRLFSALYIQIFFNFCTLYAWQICLVCVPAFQFSHQIKSRITRA